MSSAMYTTKESGELAATRPASQGASGGVRIGAPDDAYEREADRIAEEIMAGEAPKAQWSLSNMGINAPLLRKCACGGSAGSDGQCQECKAKEGSQQTLQRKASSAAAPEFAPPSVHEVLNSPGQPLDQATRDYFEPKLGHDFSKVRVHTDSRARDSARAVNATAYTVGNHVAFAEEQFALASAANNQLLAHELAHTVQQTHSNVGSRLASATSPDHTRRSSNVGAGQALALVQASSPFEQEANRAADSIVGGGVATIAGRSPAAVARNGPPSPSTPPSTAAQPGRIIREGRTAFGPSVEIEVGDAVERLGLEKTLPSGTEVNLKGWQRAHQIGPGLGAESGSGILYAPPEVNLEYQNSGIERFIRDFNKNKAPDVRLRLVTETEAHPNSLRLKSITYRLSAVRGAGRPKALFEVKINIPNVTNSPRVTLEDPEILGDWHELLAPGKSIEPPISAGGEGATKAAGKAGGEGAAKAAGEAAGEGATKAAGAASGKATQGTKAPGTTPVRVSAEIEVTNSVKQPDGTTVSDVEYKFGENFKEVNQGAPPGSEVPARMVIRVTQDAEGAITSVESLSGQPQALAEALVRKSLTPRLVGETAAAAASAGRTALLFKGLKIGGWAAFAVITGYQLYKATPRQRPKVATQAAAGLAGGAAATYLVCNVLLDIETAGWGLLICGFVAGGAGGIAASEAAGVAYDEATATELDRALHQLDGKSKNERALFNIIAGKLGTSDTCINADFVNGFLAAIPRGLQDYETVLLASQIAKAPLAVPQPPNKPPSNSPPPAKKGGECVGTACHGRSPEYLQRGLPNLDKKTIEAIMAAPTCSSILSEALRMLRTAVAQLPRNQRVSGDISHRPVRGDPTPPPKPKIDPNAFPTLEEQKEKITCPTCHDREGDQHAFDLIKEMRKELSPQEKDLLRQWAESQK